MLKFCNFCSCLKWNCLIFFTWTNQYRKLKNKGGTNSQQTVIEKPHIASANDNDKAVLYISLELLTHPVCIEILKGEFDRAHCLENLIFYLYVVRYRKMQSSLIRKMLATHIFNTFIADGSELQINISQRQKENIAAAIQRSGGDATPLSLYDETRKEIMLLIENNVM